MLIDERNLHRKNQTCILISDGENHISPEHDIWTDICNYRVALLSKNHVMYHRVVSSTRSPTLIKFQKLCFQYILFNLSLIFNSFLGNFRIRCTSQLLAGSKIILYKFRECFLYFQPLRGALILLDTILFFLLTLREKLTFN